MAVQTRSRPGTRPPAARRAPVHASPVPPAAIDAGAVESLLTDLLAAYGELASLAAEHRAAISRADGDAVEACARREAGLAARLADIEQRRRALASAPPGERVTISSVVERLPQPARARAAELVSRLRETVKGVQRDYATIRAATQSIVAHIDGLVQQVSRRLSGTGTYGPEGRVEAAKTVPCGIDVTH